MKHSLTTTLHPLAAALALLSTTAVADTQTVDGIVWKYMVSENTASVGGGSYSSPAVSMSTTGAIVIPSTLGGYPVTSIGEYAFSGCIGLTNVTIPDSVTSIGYRAFEGCSGLTSVTIPDSVTRIEDWAFYGCSGLEAFSVADGNPAYKSVSGLLLTKDGTMLVAGVNGKVVIPDSVTRIEYYAFGNCSGLTSVTIPDSVTRIENGAFSGCSGLTSVRIPDSVTDIGGWVFSDCWGLYDTNTLPGVRLVDGWAVGWADSLSEIFSKSLDLTGSRGIAGYAFNHSSGLTSVTIGNSVTDIGGYAFYGCSGLTNVTIGNSVMSIGGWAFCGCSGLTSVTIPDSVTTIEGNAFSGCSGLTSVTIGNSVTSIGGGAFSGCSGLTRVRIPDSVTRIGDDAFYGCSGLMSVTIGNSVMSIGGYAFRDCSGLKRVTIPDSVTNIGARAFSGCSGLTSVTIGNSVTSIGWYAFSGCSGLTSVTIGNCVTSIGYGAFEGCSNLTTLYVPASWEGTDMLDIVDVPSGCTVVYGGAPETEETSAGVPYSWIDENAADILASNGGDHEAAANANAANGLPVWQCYVAGLSPTNATAAFKVKSISFENGEPVVEWDPDLNEGVTEPERAYKLLGKRFLSEDDWTELPDGVDVDAGGWRFFRVGVGMPE